MLRLKAGSPARHSPILQRHLADLHRGHGRGASPSKPSRRVRSSHPPHQSGRAGRTGRAGSSADDSRAASTAYGFRTPPVLPPVTAASSVGIQPVFSTVSTTGASLARWAAVNRQDVAMAAKNSPTGPLSPRSTMGSASRKCARAADGSADGSLDGSGATAAPRETGYPQLRRRRARGAAVAPRQIGRHWPAARWKTGLPGQATGGPVRPRRLRPGRRAPGSGSGPSLAAAGPLA
jgi:hypothetical protein